MNDSHQQMDKIAHFITEVIRCIRTAIIYGAGHAVTVEACESGFLCLEDLLSDSEKITLAIVGDEFVFNREPFFELSERQKRFIQRLKEIEIERLEFRSGITQTEFTAFITIMAKNIRSPDNEETVISQLNASGIQTISVGGITTDENEPQWRHSIDRISENAKVCFQNGLDFLKEISEDLRQDRPVNLSSLRQIMKELVKNLLISKDLLLMLTSIKMQSQEKFVHNLNVCILTLMQSESLGLHNKYLLHIGQAALLHNIGELYEENQETALIEEEPSNEMSSNLKSARILLNSEGISPLAALAAFEHPLHWDEKTYPVPFYGENLNIVSMMIAISKSYDTMRREPEEHEGYRPEVVYDRMMAQSGTVFHPDLLNNFFATLGVYPPGTLVLLDNHEAGIVIQGSLLDKRRPRVEIIYDSAGHKIKQPRLVNLMERNRRGEYRRTIVRSILTADRFSETDGYA